MAKTFAASIRDFASRTKEAMDDVLRSSVEDVMALASATQESYKTREGPAIQGFVPVNTGHLRNTLAADVNGDGQFGVDTETDVSLQISEMGAGDYLHVAWTAAYAHRINSGFVGTDSLGRTYEQGGVHFVERAADGWEDIVQANAEFLKP